MVKAFHKVQKQISKKRGGRLNSLHENSRDSRRLRTAGAREDKITKLLATASRANRTYVDRVAFFQAAVEGTSAPIGEEELRVLTARYIARDDEELAGLRTQRRSGRPSSSQEDQIRHRIEMEENEFKSGFWIPDLRDDEGVRKLRAWNGNWSSLNTLKFVRISRESGIRASTFPPKGLS